MPFLHNLQTLYTQLRYFPLKLGLLGTHFPCFACKNRGIYIEEALLHFFNTRENFLFREEVYVSAPRTYVSAPETHVSAPETCVPRPET